MTMLDAVRSCLRQYAGFSGRARRSEYWYWALAMSLTYITALVADLVLLYGVTSVPVLTFSVLVAGALPSWAVTVRRLHDTGRTGWWFAVSAVPGLSLVVLVFECLDSDPQHNRYGPSPKPALPVQYGATGSAAEQYGSYAGAAQYGGQQYGGQQYGSLPPAPRPPDDPFAPPRA